jgi:two-component system chemotaxis response regulator CheY
VRFASLSVKERFRTQVQGAHVAKTILIVDDSETVRQQVGTALEQAGYLVVRAVDGSDGWLQLAKRPFDLAILDVNMPRLGGLELLERVRKDANLRHIPVLMLTTEMRRESIDRAKAAGAKGWMTKPVKLDALVATVERVIS